MKKIGVEITATGIVDNIGSGVPFKEWTISVAQVVTSVGNTVANIIAVRVGQGRPAR